MSVSYTLMPHQQETVDYVLANDYVIANLGVGVGKTLAVQHLCSVHGLKTLVICPAYLIDNWVNEIKKFTPHLIISVFKKGKDIYRVWDADMVITSYELSLKAEHLFQWAEIVAYDEAHYLKGMESRRTDESHRLVYENEVPKLVLLTGTPIQNRVYEFYSLMALCNYNPKLTHSKFLDEFPTYLDFAERFSYKEEYDIVVKNRRRRIVQFRGLKNKEELQKWLQGIFIRYEFDQKDLPNGITIPVHVDSFKNDPALLDDFEKNQEEIGEKANSRAKKESALNKAAFTVKYAKNLLDSGEEKIVIFSDHVASAEYIAEQLGVSAITGAVSTTKRTKIVNEFVSGTANFIVGTIGAMSSGLTMVVSNNTIFNDYNWKPGEMKQAKGRTRRKGQTKVCKFHFMLGSPQDEIILDRISQKEATITEVFE